MLLRPGLDELLKFVDNKYTLSVLVAKRARQLLQQAQKKLTLPILTLTSMLQWR